MSLGFTTDSSCNSALTAAGPAGCRLGGSFLRSQASGCQCEGRERALFPGASLHMCEHAPAFLMAHVFLCTSMCEPPLEKSGRSTCPPSARPPPHRGQRPGRQVGPQGLLREVLAGPLPARPWGASCLSRRSACVWAFRKVASGAGSSGGPHPLRQGFPEGAPLKKRDLCRLGGEGKGLSNTTPPPPPPNLTHREQRGDD